MVYNISDWVTWGEVELFTDSNFAEKKIVIIKYRYHLLNTKFSEKNPYLEGKRNPTHMVELGKTYFLNVLFKSI